MVIAVSTGCCHDLGLGRLESIHYLERFRGLIDGVEVLVAYPDELLKFEFDEQARSFLKSLEFTSVHMPFKDVEYTDKKETAMLVEKGIGLAEEIGARYLLFHPQTVKDFDVIKAEIPACIENMARRPKNKGYQTVEEITKLLDKHKFLGFVLDTGHAIGNSIKLEDFLALEGRLKAVHVNVQWKKGGELREHGFLAEGDAEQLNEIKKLSAINAPKILEVDFYPEKVQLIEKEISLLKALSCKFP